MATQTIISKQLRLCLQDGLEKDGSPIIKKKSFSNIDAAGTAEQLLATGKALAGLQALPLVTIEQQIVQTLED